MGDSELEVRLFTRITRTSKTPEGLQKSNISIFEYESIDFAWAYFSDYITEEQWGRQIETGEGFYFIKGNGIENTIFLETRKIRYSKNV